MDDACETPQKPAFLPPVDWRARHAALKAERDALKPKQLPLNPEGEE